ncbi:MAG TPA: PP2C family protein-serine/threonine phosphatase [Terracidiphilus sp.]|nr:PP2C family protein-serine/threonine phosphatase [Terracidiphilus sp.]
MYLAEAQMTTSEVLRAFQHNEPGLFLGSAFMTVGLVAAGFCLMRRKADVLLISLAVFAFLYGERLWWDSALTVPAGEFLRRIRHAINPLVPVPAFIFFQTAGLLPRRGKPYTYVAISIFLILTLLTTILGWQPILHQANNVVVIIALIAVLVHSVLQGSRDRDYRVLRGGLLVFVGLALWDNSLGQHLGWTETEPYGFAVFLSCMGYVAGRRVLRRDQELTEVRQELELARRIQLSILPEKFPDSTPFDVAARYVPMTSVAGDLYDFLVAGDRQAGLLIADVSGHGVPAALIASMVKMAATSQRAHAAHPAELLAGMNAALCGNTQGQFVTAAYVYLDGQARELRYAAAGHPSMLLMRNGQVTEIAENGLLLAATGEAAYTQRTLTLERGDRLLLYTDGLLEAKNAEGRLFGDASLAAALERTIGLAAADAVQRIIAEVQQWAASQEDDLTALVCDFVAAG